MGYERIEVLNQQVRSSAREINYAFRISTAEIAGDEVTSLLCVTKGAFAEIGGDKKLYAININHIECIVGEWNKDKTEYGARVFYASGNSVWIGNVAAKELLKKLNVGGESEHFVRTSQLDR